MPMMWRALIPNALVRRLPRVLHLLSVDVVFQCHRSRIQGQRRRYGFVGTQEIPTVSAWNVMYFVHILCVKWDWSGGWFCNFPGEAVSLLDGSGNNDAFMSYTLYLWSASLCLFVAASREMFWCVICTAHSLLSCLSFSLVFRDEYSAPWDLILCASVAFWVRFEVLCVVAL